MPRFLVKGRALSYSYDGYFTGPARPAVRPLHLLSFASFSLSQSCSSRPASAVSRDSSAVSGTSLVASLLKMKY